MYKELILLNFFRCTNNSNICNNNNKMEHNHRDISAVSRESGRRKMAFALSTFVVNKYGDT